MAILGRSNAGKSSLINAMYITRIAKVSSTPGHTKLINFFQIGEKYRLIDLPGYGFAARAETERVSWRDSVETYLATRSCLVGFILVMDIRRDWQLEETDLIHWLQQRGLPWILVLTKTDKMSRSQAVAREKQVLKQVKAARVSLPAQVFLCSSSKRSGVAEVEEFFYKKWVRTAKIQPLGAEIWNQEN